MKNVKITRVRLANFKGIKKLDFAFGQETNISGDNGTGKTSLFDSVLWLLFGRDSEGKTDFAIKSLDANGKPVHQLEHEVEVYFDVNGEALVLRKVYREKWTKKRNTNIPELTGHENLYFWNEVPQKESEFKVAVAQIMDEKLFKLLTNPLYFNTQLKWEERRKVLLEMATPVTVEQVISAMVGHSAETLQWLQGELAKKKTIENLRDELRYKTKAIKDELEVIPVRIDEAYKTVPMIDDYSVFRKTIAEQQAIISQLEVSKENVLKANQEANKAVMERQQAKNNLERELQAKRHELRYAYESKLNELRGKLDMMKQANQMAITHKANSQTQIDSYIHQIHTYQQSLEALRAEWNAENAKQFQLNEKDIICPSCQRQLDEVASLDIINRNKDKFNADKQERLNGIMNRASTVKNAIASLEKNIEYVKAKIEDVPPHDEATIISTQNEIEALQSTPPTDTQEIYDMVAQINAIVITPVENTNFGDINTKIAECNNIIREAEKQLALEGMKDQIEKRVEELSERESQLSQELTYIEQRLFACEEYNRARIDMLVQSVNHRFTFTRFRLFEEQVNGALVECCEALINTNGSWVPFDSANNAGRINAGVDIINALSNYYAITAPIFIDNREGVNNLILTNSQVINLRVSNEKVLSLHS